MKICVQGLWHLGSVTAACLASVGHDVIGLDDGATNIKNLKQLLLKYYHKFLIMLSITLKTYFFLSKGYIGKDISLL